jgi:hypothetical protein
VANLGLPSGSDTTGGPDAATPPTYPPVSSIHIPSEEQSWLEALAGPSGNIDGVPAVFLAIIDQAESSGDGGGINPEGYGGYFGLGEAQAGASTLQGTSQAAFDAQAALVAQDFGAQLNRYSGNPVQAEEAYQEGSYSPSKQLSEGASLFESYGVGGTNSGVINTAGSSKSSDSGGGGPTDILSIAGAVSGSLWNYMTGTGSGSGLQAAASTLTTAERDTLAIFSGWTGFIQTMLLTAFFAIAALIVLFVLVKGKVGALPIPV